MCVHGVEKDQVAGPVYFFLNQPSSHCCLSGHCQWAVSLSWQHKEMRHWVPLRDRGCPGTWHSDSLLERQPSAAEEGVGQCRVPASSGVQTRGKQPVSLLGVGPLPALNVIPTLPLSSKVHHASLLLTVPDNITLCLSNSGAVLGLIQTHLALNSGSANLAKKPELYC